MHLRNDLNHLIHISLKNSLEKIIKIKKEHCYLVNKDSHGLITLKLLPKCQWNKHPHLETSINEDVPILFNIKTHQNAKPYKLEEIVNKYSNI